MSQDHLETMRRTLAGEEPARDPDHDLRLAGIAGRYGLDVHQLANLHGQEWEWLRDNPEALEAATAALVVAKGKYQGRVPATWTDTLDCPRCGPVAIWPGGGRIDDAVGCPWCPVRYRQGQVPEGARR